MIEFLSHEQVCELTGAKSKAAQIKNLKLNGIRHTIKVSGWPCVTVAAVLGIEQPAATPAIPDRPVWVPDFSKVR